MHMKSEEFNKLLERQKNKPDIIIAIDPDCEKSGYAYLKVDTRSMILDKMVFPDLIWLLHNLKNDCDKLGKKLMVVIEKGWVNEKNYHIKFKPGMSLAYASNIGIKIGRNHETGRKIVEMCEALSIPHDEIAPLRKCWKGKDGKITADEFRQITGVTGRYNQDMRDAGLMAWVYANLPLKLKV